MKILLCFCFILLSCTSDKELPNYSNQDFLAMGREGDPDLKVIIPTSITETVVNCNEYTPACRYGLKVIVKNIEMRALFYDSQKDALKAALRRKAYISRNWVLDEVNGEPVLERFAMKYLKAKKASEVKKSEN